VGTDGSCNESCVLSMGSIPVSSIKYSDSIITIDWKALKKPNEAPFIIKLREISMTAFGHWELLALSSGREDITSNYRETIIRYYERTFAYERMVVALD
jgi:hypothetical protein